METIKYASGLWEDIDLRASEINARKSPEDAEYACAIFRGAIAYAANGEKFAWHSEGLEWRPKAPDPAPPMKADADECDRCGAVVGHLDAGFSPAAVGYKHGGCGGRWRRAPPGTEATLFVVRRPS